MASLSLLLTLPVPVSALFPYTTLFRSVPVPLIPADTCRMALPAVLMTPPEMVAGRRIQVQSTQEGARDLALLSNVTLMVTVPPLLEKVPVLPVNEPMPAVVNEPLRSTV